MHMVSPKVGLVEPGSAFLHIIQIVHAFQICVASHDSSLLKPWRCFFNSSLTL